MANVVKIGLEIGDNGTLQVTAASAKKVRNALLEAQRAAVKLSTGISDPNIRQELEAQVVNAKQLTAELARISKESKAAARALDTVNNKGVLGGGTPGLERGSAAGNARGGARDFARQAQGMGGLVHTYATFAANIWAVTAAYTALASAFEAERIEKAAEMMSVKTGIYMKGLAKDLQEVSGYSISMKEAFEFSALGTQAGLTSKEIKNLVEVAKGAANVLGRDVNDSIQRIIRGTAKMEQEILDELGIFVRAKDANKAYAKELGVTSELMLTQSQRVHAYAEAVAKAGEKYKEFASIADPFSKLKATIAIAGTDILNFVNKAIVPLIDSLSKSGDLVTGLLVGGGLFLTKMALPAVVNFKKELFDVEDQLEKIRKLRQIAQSDVELRLDQGASKILKNQDRFAPLAKTIGTQIEKEFAGAIKSNSVSSALKSAFSNSANFNEFKQVFAAKINETVDNYKSKAQTALNKGDVAASSTLVAKAAELETQKTKILARTEQIITANQAHTAIIAEQNLLLVEQELLLEKEAATIALTAAEQKAINAAERAQASSALASGLLAFNGSEIKEGWAKLMALPTITGRVAAGMGTAFKVMVGGVSAIVSKLGYVLAAWLLWDLAIKPLATHLGWITNALASSNKAIDDSIAKTAIYSETITKGNIALKNGINSVAEYKNILDSQNNAFKAAAEAIDVESDAIDKNIDKMGLWESAIESLLSVFNADTLSKHAKSMRENLGARLSAGGFDDAPELKKKVAEYANAQKLLDEAKANLSKTERHQNDTTYYSKAYRDDARAIEQLEANITKYEHLLSGLGYATGRELMAATRAHDKYATEIKAASIDIAASYEKTAAAGKAATEQLASEKVAHGILDPNLRANAAAFEVQLQHIKTGSKNAIPLVSALATSFNTLSNSLLVDKATATEAIALVILFKQINTLLSGKDADTPAMQAKIAALTDKALVHKGKLDKLQNENFKKSESAAIAKSKRDAAEQKSAQELERIQQKVLEFTNSINQRKVDGLKQDASAYDIKLKEASLSQLNLTQEQLSTKYSFDKNIAIAEATKSQKTLDAAYEKEYNRAKNHKNLQAELTAQYNLQSKEISDQSKVRLDQINQEERLEKLQIAKQTREQQLKFYEDDALTTLERNYSIQEKLGTITQSSLQDKQKELALARAKSDFDQASYMTSGEIYSREVEKYNIKIREIEANALVSKYQETYKETQEAINSDLQLTSSLLETIYDNSYKLTDTTQVELLIQRELEDTIKSKAMTIASISDASQREITLQQESLSIAKLRTDEALKLFAAQKAANGGTSTSGSMIGQEMANRMIEIKKATINATDAITNAVFGSVDAGIDKLFEQLKSKTLDFKELFSNVTDAFKGAIYDYFASQLKSSIKETITSIFGGQSTDPIKLAQDSYGKLEELVKTLGEQKSAIVTQAEAMGKMNFVNGALSVHIDSSNVANTVEGRAANTTSETVNTESVKILGRLTPDFSIAAAKAANSTNEVIEYTSANSTTSIVDAVKGLAPMVGASASGLQTLSSAIGSSSGTGLFGAISGISNVVSTFSKVGSFVGNIFGKFAMSGVGQALGLSTGMSAGGAAALANGTTMAANVSSGALTSLGSTIATALPYIGAALSVISLFGGGLFGGGHVMRPKGYADTSVSSTGTKGMGSWTNGEGNVSGQAVTAGADIGKFLNTLTKKLGGTIEKSFIIGTKYMAKYNSTGVSIGQRISKTNSEVTFINDSPEHIGIGYATVFLKAVKKGLIEIPEYIQNFLNNAVGKARAQGTKANAKTVLDDAITLKSVYDSLHDSIIPVFKNTAILIEGIAKESTLKDITQITDALKKYYETFTPAAQQVKDAVSTLTTGLLNAISKGANDTMDTLVGRLLSFGNLTKIPASNPLNKIQELIKNVDLMSFHPDQALKTFDAILNGVDQTTKEGRELFKTLLGLSESFATLVAQTNQMNFTNVSNQFQTQLDLVNNLDLGKVGVDSSIQVKKNYRDFLAKSLDLGSNYTIQSAQQKLKEYLDKPGEMTDYYTNIWKTFFGQLTEAAASSKADLSGIWSRFEASIKPLIDGFKSVRESLLQYRDSLKLGDLSILTPQKKYEEARAQFDTLNAKIKDTSLSSQDRLAAMEGLQTASDNLLNASKVVNGSSQSYQRDYTEVLATVDSTALQAKTQSEYLQSIYDEQRSMVAAILGLGEDTSLSDINMTITQWQSALVTAFNSAQTAALAASGTTTGSTTVIKDPASPVIAASTVHATNPHISLLGAGSLRNVLPAMNTFGIPTHAQGGLAKAGLALVGEAGPELVDFKSPGRVYTAEQTQEFIGNANNAQNMGVIVQELEKLRAELAMLRTEQQKQTADLINHNYSANDKAADKVAKTNKTTTEQSDWLHRSKAEFA